MRASDHSGTASTFSSSSVRAVGLATSHTTGMHMLVMSIWEAAANSQNEQQVDGGCHHASCPPCTNLRMASWLWVQQVNSVRATQHQAVQHVHDWPTALKGVDTKLAGAEHSSLAWCMHTLFTCTIVHVLLRSHTCCSRQPALNMHTCNMTQTKQVITIFAMFEGTAVPSRESAWIRTAHTGSCLGVGWQMSRKS